MTATVSLTATARPRVGKGAARAERRAGRIPAVIYGGKEPAVPISVEARDLTHRVHSASFMTTIFEIDVEGAKTRVLPRDLQLDPVKDFPVHVDFLRLTAGSSISVAVPVNFLNEEDCPGLRRGGVLNVVRHEIEVMAPADAIPDHIDADLTGLDLGDSLHISAVKLPANVTPTITDRDFTIATIAAPAGLRSEGSQEEGEGEEE